VFRLFGSKGWTAAGIGAIAAFVVLGVPTAMIGNPFFIRMIPVRDQDYVIWIVSSLLLGLVIGT
jgi:polysaccharide pyruvyl transferase WcaK-like protein